MAQLDMAHVLGSFAKWAIVIVALGFSITLSYMFFQAIAPPDKPWFPYAALALTEGGFILWLIVFMLTRHHPVHKSIALVMTCACAFCSLVVAGYEFYGLMAAHYDIASNTWLLQGVSILLEVIFAFHVIALILDLFASYFAKPGHAFRTRGNLIPAQYAQHGNLIPTHSRVKVEELVAMQNAITGYLTAIQGGETEDPLEVSSPQEEELTLLQVAKAVADVVKEDVSSLTKKVKGSMKRGKRGVPAPGEASGTTSENTSTEENSNEDGN